MVLIEGLKNRKVFRFLFLCAMGLIMSACSFEKEGINPSKQAEYLRTKCWTCQFFSYVYSGLGKLSQNTAEGMTKASLSLLGVGLAIWLLIHITKEVILTMQEPNYREMWAKLFKTVGKATLVATVLAKKETFFWLVNTIYVPIVELMLFFAMKIIDIDTGTRGLLHEQGINVRTTYPNMEAFPRSIASQIEVLIYKIQVALSIGSVIGIRIIATGELSAILMGLIVIGMFFYLSIVFPLFFIDAIIRFGLAIILMPLFLVAWVFQETKHMFTEVWKMIFGTGAQFVVGCIFATYVLSMMDAFLNQRMGAKTSSVVQSASPSLVQDVVRLNTSGLLLFVLCVYILKFIARVPNVAGKLSGTPAQPSIMKGAIDDIKKVGVTLVALAATAVTAAVGGGTSGGKAVQMAAAAVEKVSEAAPGNGEGD